MNDQALHRKPQTNHKTLEEVAAMLDLPTAEDVANLLREHGARQRPASEARSYLCCCPVGTFVSRLTGSEVSASQSLLELSDSGYVATPRAAAEFITRFDCGDFYDLSLSGIGAKEGSFLQ